MAARLPSPAPTPQGLSLRGRLLVGAVVPTLAALAVGGTLLYGSVRGVLEAQLGASLAQAAATVASQLKAERVLAVEPDDARGEGSRTYRSLKAQLTEAKEAAGFRRVLVFDEARRARLDVGGALPPGAEVPELVRDEAELTQVFGTRAPASSQVLFEGTDGLFYKTGYAPIVADGKVVAVVAVEGSAAFFGPLAAVRSAFVGLAALTLLLLAVVAVLSARSLSAPLERLVASALRIGGGDLGTPVAQEPTREIGVLARELEAMRAALNERDRTLKMMLGGVAHEVKNPLGGIELFTGLIDEELSGAAPNLADAKGHLAHVRRELDYLKRIVEDFLAFAREQRLAATDFDAARWVREAVSHLDGEARSRGVRLAVDAAAATVRGDESLLTGALVNLVKNAVQASREGQGVAVTSTVEGPSLRVTVADEGGGIAADVLPHIFEPFYTTREKGTGLGLPLAKKLIEAHGGALTVESKPGATRFTVTLPLTTQHG